MQLARSNEIIFQKIAVYTSSKLNVETIDIRSYERKFMETANRINGTNGRKSINGRKSTNSKKIKEL